MAEATQVWLRENGWGKIDVSSFRRVEGEWRARARIDDGEWAEVILPDAVGQELVDGISAALGRLRAELVADG